MPTKIQNTLRHRVEYSESKEMIITLYRKWLVGKRAQMLILSWAVDQSVHFVIKFKWFNVHKIMYKLGKIIPEFASHLHKTLWISLHMQCR